MLIGLDLGFTHGMIAIPALMALTVIVKFFDSFPAIAPVIFSIIAFHSLPKAIAMLLLLGRILDRLFGSGSHDLSTSLG
jgi:hypothetical protein